MKKRVLLSESARKNVTPEQNARYAEALKQMIDCKTVWTADGENQGEFKKFYRVVAALFPTLHSRAKRLTFGGGCFFYLIEGSNAKQNVLLMSHHDVVDCPEGWDTDPFRAEIRDGALYGRGTIDTKTPLFAELQAVEELLRQGHSFEGMNLYIGSSNNEEVSGDGMVLAAEHFRREGIRFDVILDEGGAITAGLIPGVSAKSAMVAVHEKSRHRFRCTATQNDSGHASLSPNADSMVARMAGFITEVTSANIFKGRFYPEVRATFEHHAPYMSFPMNFLFRNLTLFAPIIKKIMLKIPQAAPMLATGCTFTSLFAGKPGSAQPRAQEAEAMLYLRCIREDDLYAGLEKIKAIGQKYGVEITQTERDFCQPTDFTKRPFRVLEETLNENFPDVIVAPYLLTAGTDARRFSDIGDSILRFAPIDLNKQQFSSIHGKNENITVQNIGQCVLFYQDFLKKIYKGASLS